MLQSNIILELLAVLIIRVIRVIRGQKNVAQATAARRAQTISG